MKNIFSAIVISTLFFSSVQASICDESIYYSKNIEASMAFGPGLGSKHVSIKIAFLPNSPKNDKILVTGFPDHETIFMKFKHANEGNQRLKEDKYVAPDTNIRILFCRNAKLLNTFRYKISDHSEIKCRVNKNIVCQMY